VFAFQVRISRPVSTEPGMNVQRLL